MTMELFVLIFSNLHNIGLLQSYQTTKRGSWPQTPKTSSIRSIHVTPFYLYFLLNESYQKVIQSQTEWFYRYFEQQQWWIWWWKDVPLDLFFFIFSWTISFPEFWIHRWESEIKKWRVLLSSLFHQYHL